jgi:hypothetical protein
MKTFRGAEKQGKLLAHWGGPRETDFEFTKQYLLLYHYAWRSMFRLYDIQICRRSCSINTDRRAPWSIDWLSKVHHTCFGHYWPFCSHTSVHLWFTLIHTANKRPSTCCYCITTATHRYEQFFDVDFVTLTHVTTERAFCSYKDRGSGVRFPAGAGNFSLHHGVQNGCGAHPASYAMGTRGSFPGVKAAGEWSWPHTSI